MFYEIDYVPATGNKWLLTDLLRAVGFKGFVVSDYTSLNEMTWYGRFTNCSALALNAGLDMDGRRGITHHLGKSLKEGKSFLAAIDQACLRILEAKHKLSLMTL
jgi:beta-glucosidase